MKYRILHLVCFLYCCVISAQNCNLIFSGKVEDFHENAILEQAVVKIIELNKYTTTDKKGSFKFKNLCAGSFTIKISHVACETKLININLKNDLYRDISLEHHLEELDEITVKSNEKKETKTAQETIIKANTIDKYSGMSLGDALKEVSGISSINTGNSIVKPMINGLHSSRVLILNNGVRQQDQEWGIEHAPNIDINSASQISVIKGSGALAYSGDAIGGVIVINPSKTNKKDTLYGKTIIGGQTNGRGYNMSSTINKNYRSGWFAQVQGSYKRNGDFEAPDYSLTNTGVNSKGFSTRFGKKIFESGFEVFYSYVNNEIGILRTSHIGSVGDLARAINTPQPFVIKDFSYDIDVPKQDVTHHLAKVNYYKRFKNFGKVNLQYDYQYNQRVEFDVRRGNLKFTPAVDLVLQTHSVLADVNLDSNLERKINFGIVGRYQNNFANPNTGARRLIPDYDKYDFGLYTTSEWRLNDNTILDAGIRYDFSRIDAKKFYIKSRWNERGYNLDFANLIIGETPTQFLTNPVFDYHNISASAGIKYNLNDNSYLVGNYALSMRPPNPSELFSDGLHHSAARFEFGDLRIDQEVSNRTSASYNYSNSKFNFLAETYYNNINDFIYIRPTVKGFEITGRGPFPAWEYIQNNTSIFGLDVSASYQFNESFNYQNKSSFIKGKDKIDDIPLINMPPFNTTNSITYNNKNWYNFSARLSSEWTFRQNEFPDFNFSITDELTNEEINVNISTPTPAYHLMNFFSEATFNLNKKTNLNVAFSVDNIFNTNYRNYLNVLRYFSDEIGRNFKLQLTLKF